MKTLTLSSLTLLLVACANQPDVESRPGSPLTIDILEDDHLAGTFEHSGALLAFDLARTAEGGVTTFRDSRGHALMTTTVQGGEQVTSILDGRLVVRGTVGDPDPVFEGDRAALDELAATPEAALVPELRDALVAQDIDLERYALRPGFDPLIWDNGDGSFFFYPGETNSWLSATFGLPTYVDIWNHNPYGCAEVRLLQWGWKRNTLVVPAGRSMRATLYWWGAHFVVENVYSSNLCPPSNVSVRVSY